MSGIAKHNLLIYLHLMFSNWDMPLKTDVQTQSLI